MSSSCLRGAGSGCVRIVPVGMVLASGDTVDDFQISKRCRFDDVGAYRVAPKALAIIFDRHANLTLRVVPNGLIINIFVLFINLNKNKTT